MKMRIDLARGAVILQRRASYKPMEVGWVYGRKQCSSETHFERILRVVRTGGTFCSVGRTARYVIRGAAILMVDAWKSTIKIECRKADENES